MLKQSPRRNQRSKGFKVKHALYMVLLLAICSWLVYQLKHSHDKKANEEISSAKMLGKIQTGHGMVRLGRRGLHPWADETFLHIGRHGEKEEESKGEESEEERGAEEDSEGVEDLIDEEDTEREEEAEEQETVNKATDLESLRLLEYTRDTQETIEEHYKDPDASSSVNQNTRTITNEIEVGRLRKVKEEEFDYAEKIEQTKLSNDSSVMLVENADSVDASAASR